MPTKRTMSITEKLTREYHSDVRKFKKWCTENKRAYYDFKTAPENFVCALSKNEYSLGVRRRDLDEDNEDYFIHEDYYAEWQEYIEG